MASITIRDLDESTKSRLRLRAAQHGRSMEEEVRSILRTALVETETDRPGLAGAIRRRFRACRGVDLKLPGRKPMREPPEPGT